MNLAVAQDSPGIGMLKGIAKKFGSKPKKSKKQIATEARSMTQLKVRVEGLIKCFKAIVDGKRKIPLPVKSFLRRLSADGIYFPHGFLFDHEMETYMFNDFGRIENQRGMIQAMPPANCHKLDYTDLDGNGIPDNDQTAKEILVR